MNCSVALCIITYERSELIQEFLENCADYYMEAGIDIYVYDSSSSDATEKLVTEWRNRERLFYIGMPSSLSLFEKELMIFREYGDKQQYDFLWLCNDSTQYSYDDLEKILQSVDSSYDYVVFDAEHEIGTREYTDPEELFDSYCEAYHVGASMVNVHTMLLDVDWQQYVPVFKPDGGETFLFYYRRFLELESFRAIHIEVKTRRLSALKKKSNYNDNNVKAALNVVHAFSLFPESYSGKWEICRRFNAEALMGSISDFDLYRRQGVFSLDVLFRYWQLWDKMTYVPRYQLLVISLIPRCILIHRHESKKKKCKRKLMRFLGRHQNIAIYGAGNHGAAFGEYMTVHGYPFDFFCVTKRKPGKYFFCGYPVRTFDEVRDNCSEMGFIVALSKKNAPEVVSELKNSIGESHFFYDRWYETAVREEMGYQAYSAI